MKVRINYPSGQEYTVTVPDPARVECGENQTVSIVQDDGNDGFVVAEYYHCLGWIILKPSKEG